MHSFKAIGNFGPPYILLKAERSAPNSWLLGFKWPLSRDRELSSEDPQGTGTAATALLLQKRAFHCGVVSILRLEAAIKLQK